MTQCALLKAAFDRGESLTVAEALTRYGIYALSQRVGELERSGVPIDHVPYVTPTGKRVMSYRLMRVPFG